MPTKADLESEVAILRTQLSSQNPPSYMERVSPNLIVLMHYGGKALWLMLAAFFGLIGFYLYEMGVQATGDATAELPLGISFSLQGAGPGLVVMVIALLCSLVGAIKAKVELTPEAIRLMAPAPSPTREREPQTEDSETGAAVHDTDTIEGIENLNKIWGLSEVAQLYRTPLADLVSDAEAAEIESLQARRPLPDGWAEQLCALVRQSKNFKDWLRALPSRDLPSMGAKQSRIDPKFPWCVRLRWGAGAGETVDLFIYATADSGSDS